MRFLDRSSSVTITNNFGKRSILVWRQNGGEIFYFQASGYNAAMHSIS